LTYKINILPNAEDDLKWYREHSKQDFLKCFDLLRAIALEPRQGIGKPERLRYFDNEEVYSRRVNHKDRIIYNIYESDQVIDISSCKVHYD
jgi:toxin YoeB